MELNPLMVLLNCMKDGSGILLLKHEAKDKADSLTAAGMLMSKSEKLFRRHAQK